MNRTKSQRSLKNLIPLSAIVFSVAFAFWIYKVFFHAKDDITTSQQIDVVTRRNLDSTVVAMGTIKPMQGAEVRVGSRASGIMKRMKVKVGDAVSQGDTLAEIDKLEYEAILKQWQAAMKSSNAEFQYSSLAVTRLIKLFEDSLASVQDKDLAEKVQIIAEYAHKQDEANLEAARVRLEYTEITSPLSGVVASINVDEGETVAASFLAPTLLTIIDPSKLELWAYVDEADIGRISIGQQAEFFISTYPNLEFEGRVVVIQPKATIIEGKVKYVCVIEITDKKGMTLRPEMTATVKLKTEALNNVLAVPNWAISLEGRRPYIKIVKGGKRIKKWIIVGWKDDDFTEIVEGVGEGDTVIISEELLNSKSNRE